jgi:subtilase family serine protease
MMYMKRFFLFIISLLTFSSQVFAQDDLFGFEKAPARNGFIIAANGSLDFPAADMAKRFGTSYRVGGAVLYKTKTNWMFGVKVDFIMGNIMREDSLLINVKDKNNNVINGSGEKIGFGTFQTGYMAGLQAGWIWNISKKNADNGILFLTSAGFMQHRINLFERDNSVVQIQGEYEKGYDRLTNGFFVEQYVGYNYFAKNGLINFNIGLDIAAGFTKGRRDFLYDVMRADNKSRMDILFGIRGGWYIPIFKRKSEEIYFE